MLFISSLFNFFDVLILITSRQVLIESLYSSEKFLNLLFTFRNDLISYINIDIYGYSSDELLIFCVILLGSLAHIEAIELSFILFLKGFVVLWISSISPVNLLNILAENFSDFVVVIVDSLFKVRILSLNSG